MTARPTLGTIRWKVHDLLPNHYFFNWIIARKRFIKGNKRPPRSLRHSNATINDFIFQKMISNNWRLIEQICVDKQYAKAFATNIAGIASPKTVDVFYIEDDTTAEDFRFWLAKYAGQRYVAKPTHLSGQVLFLDNAIRDEVLFEFLEQSKNNYFRVNRETQYINLERKVIVEENISNAGVLDDYKFFCVKGKVLYCQVDSGRFSLHKRAICTVPDFNILDIRHGDHDIPADVAIPSKPNEMVDVAAKLACGFSLVRVDLYNVEGKVYFGEFTFSPGAGCDNISDEKWAVELYGKVKEVLG